MILHVTFSDGSNPWVSLPTDRHTIAKHWKRWTKNHPDTAEPIAICGRPTLSPMCFTIKGRPGYYVRIPAGEKSILRHYNHLGHALRALERLGGEAK